MNGEVAVTVSIKATIVQLGIDIKHLYKYLVQMNCLFVLQEIHMNKIINCPYLKPERDNSISSSSPPCYKGIHKSVKVEERYCANNKK